MDITKKKKISDLPGSLHFFFILKLSKGITFKVTSSLLGAKPEVKESWSSAFHKEKNKLRNLNMTFRIQGRSINLEFANCFLEKKKEKRLLLLRAHGVKLSI